MQLGLQAEGPKENFFKTKRVTAPGAEGGWILRLTTQCLEFICDSASAA